jgi:DNA-binding response OmpR family regulator
MEELTHKILIVDDEVSIQALVSDALATAKRVIFTAGTMAEACQVMDRQKIDVVVLDRMLPDGDGLEFCAKLRRNPVHKAIPVLLLSARADVDDKVLGLKLGADDYLAKPCDMAELNARIEALLRRTEELNRYRTRLC